MSAAPGSARVCAPVVIYGACGRLGRLLTRALASRGTAVIAAARDAAALERLAAEVTGIETEAVRLDDEAALRKLLERGAVLVNCVGASETLVRSALACGVDYVDSSGEQGFMRMVFERYGRQAAQADVFLLPGLGFDYAIGDCLARIAAEGREPLVELTVAYAIDRPGIGRDNVQHAARTPGAAEVVFRDGAWVPLRFALDLAFFDFPHPWGRRQMARYGAGEVITVPRHTQTRNVRTLITARTLVPHPAWLPVFPVLRPLVGWVRESPLNKLLQMAAGRRGVVHGAPASSPPPDTFTVVAVATGADGSRARALARGRDTYAVSAACLGAAACLLASGRGRGSGAASAASAFDAADFLKTVEASGLRWSVHDAHSSISST